MRPSTGFALVAGFLVGALGVLRLLDTRARRWATTSSATLRGRQAFGDHVAALRAVVGAATPARPAPRKA